MPQTKIDGRKRGEPCDWREQEEWKKWFVFYSNKLWETIGS
jgi:hypothetical protein